MKSIERIEKITEEIWHDLCGEESSYEVEQKTILHSSKDLSIDDGARETDSRCS